MTFEKKIFLKYTMDFNSFCKELTPYLTGAAIGGLCHLFYQEIKIFRARNKLLKLLREALEALEKYKESIADSQNNELKE